jgi:hypothetical protein
MTDEERRIVEQVFKITVDADGHEHFERLPALRLAPSRERTGGYSSATGRYPSSWCDLPRPAISASIIC